ncbi:oligopeptidase B [soil metagenome]
MVIWTGAAQPTSAVQRISTGTMDDDLFSFLSLDHSITLMPSRSHIYRCFSAALLLMTAGLLSDPSLAQIQPPSADQRMVEHMEHGVTRADPYFWMRDREDPEVIAYLEAENAYYEAHLATLGGLPDEIYNEIVGRIQQDDSSVPYFNRGYWYYSRFEEGQDYPIYARRPGSMDAPEEILLDVNELAEGHSYFQVGGMAVSEDSRMIAYAVDTVGRRIYTLQFKNLETGEVSSESIFPTTGNVVWANDNRTVFYARQDLGTLRSYQILRHEVGSDPESDLVVFQEDDVEFRTYVTKSRDREFLLIGSAQTVSNEWRYLDADNPSGEFALFMPRERGHEHSLNHFRGHFYVHTNDGGAQNFKLVRTTRPEAGRAGWEDVIPHRSDVLVETFLPFQDYLVVQERERGLVQLRVRPWDGADEHYIEFDEAAYNAYLSANVDPDISQLRFVYASMTTPATTYDYDMDTRERVLLKREPVLGDFDTDNYATERVMARAADGTEIPVSIVYRSDLKMDGSNPLLLYGYGSYGYSLDAGFSIPRLSLLDRGFVYAIAHIRGGQEMGRQWYEDGKLLNKMNTFTDFIAAAEHLKATGYADPERTYAMGGSAGGLLVGAVVNMRPELFHGVVAAVPFVDVVTTMLDDTIPLTTFEYDEWGNPNDPEFFAYMMSYSPYDNVTAQDYPHLLITSGLHDSQVQYWEPTKWTARLREVKAGDNLLLLRTNMEAGHGGASGRFQRFREIAQDYSFLLGLAGLAK